ncbi:uncharacterized protein LOC122042099 isoform X2 [Zingiber officinale]|uniref:uncharacterized protein LOC122042099 isoform X2 n=1 Tax=Zingiber officinale TaxID=94328 RepID=UPI001C4B90F0|nr:uncharacterized protein LOC122042099 isoform X2 [Zingiber officinale]
MLCLKAEALGHEMHSSCGVIIPANLGRSLQKLMHKVGKHRGEEQPRRRPRSDPSSSSSGDGTASCCGLDDGKSNDGAREGRRYKACCYRSQLEEEVVILQQQLKEEIDLHVALANAITNNAHNRGQLLDSPSKLPDKAQNLLETVAALEIKVLKLEKELASLQIQLCQERNERHLAEHHFGSLPISPKQLSKSLGSMWEEHISCLRASKFGLNEISSSIQQDWSSNGDTELALTNKSLDEFPEEEVLGSSYGVEEGNKLVTCLQQPDAVKLKDSGRTNLSNNSNKLSEEMVKCMRNIFLCLSEPSDITSKASLSECLPSQPSPVGQLASSSDSSFTISSSQKFSTETRLTNEIVDLVDRFDPYGVNSGVNGRNIGCYSFAMEVSWMSVGKIQLEYAAEALKGYRSLVEQLAMVDPANMNSNEKLAFWINVYNALIMHEVEVRCLDLGLFHAYLAYGVPKSDIKLFSLMQKASYVIGGQSISAAEIEFVILKMKSPGHRPQLSLVLALHEFRISEEQSSYCIDSHEPMLLFALSCGMYSSPGIRVFKADNIQHELDNSMLDYIRASIGISEKGKLLVPKLLHSYTNGIVEDSLLVDWICHHLSPNQVAIVRESTLQWKQRLLGAQSFSITPYDSRFRYLFLSDNCTCEKSPRSV